METPQKYRRAKMSPFARFAGRLLPRSPWAWAALSTAGASVWLGILFQNYASQKRNTGFFKAVMSTLSTDAAVRQYLNNDADDACVSVEGLFRGWLPLQLPMGHVNMIKGSAELQFDVIGRDPARRAHVSVRATRPGYGPGSRWNMHEFVVTSSSGDPVIVRDFAAVPIEAS